MATSDDFATEEIGNLIRLVHNARLILENKNTSENSNKKKIIVWKKITGMFNERNARVSADFCSNSNSEFNFIVSFT